jgi:hypothetical protein
MEQESEMNPNILDSIKIGDGNVVKAGDKVNVDDDKSPYEVVALIKYEGRFWVVLNNPISRFIGCVPDILKLAPIDPWAELVSDSSIPHCQDRRKRFLGENRCLNARCGECELAVRLEIISRAKEIALAEVKS